MKALTLWEPYASAIALGLKKYETCSWKTSYQGPLIIHAPVRPLNEYQDLADQYEIVPAFGYIVAVVDLVDCILMTPEFIAKQSKTEVDLGDWRPGRYAWRLENIRPITGVNISGHQGLWNIDYPIE